jgi:CheY-like chemotaxis protein
LPSNVLVVEDEAIIALDLQGILTCAGYRVIGPVASIAEALPVLIDRRLDAAILDINLGSHTVYPVADKLAGAQVPFVFVTGQALSTIPDGHRHRPLLRKPYHPLQLLQSLRQVICAAVI